MNLETIIAEKVHALPIGKQEKVLAFVEDLEHDESGKSNGKPEKTEKEKRLGRLALVGMFKRGGSDTAERAEEILSEEIDKRSGWTLKEKVVAD